MEAIRNVAEKCELECEHKKPHQWRDTKGCASVRCEAFQTWKGAEAADFPAQTCVSTNPAPVVSEKDI